MKLIFFRNPLQSYPESGQPDMLMRDAFANKLGDKSDYSKYLCSALVSDFQSIASCDMVLKEIIRMEQGVIGSTYWNGNAFNTNIYPDRVEFDHGAFGGLPEWPIWICSLEEYKAALEGWAEFLRMPVNASTQLIIELPDQPSENGA